MKPFYPAICLNPSELSELTEWVIRYSGTQMFSDANMGGNRKTTRFNNSGSLKFPATAYAVRNRIAEMLGFDFEKKPGFSDGMVASWAGEGDTCYYHKDPVWHEGLITAHCNVLLQAPEKGGKLFVEGQKYEMQVGKPICYPVSEVDHGTTKIIGSTPRIMWVFGFCVTKEKAMEKFT